MAMTFTYDEIGAIHKIIASWTSNGTGDAAATTKKITGWLIKGVTDPATAAPTADYDVVITDPEGLNVLGQCQDDLLNRHTSSTEQVYFLLKNYDGTAIGVSAFPVVADALTVTVSNAGDTKGGEIILYYWPGVK